MKRSGGLRTRSSGTLPQVFRFSYSREFHKAIVSALGKILEDNGNPIEMSA
jgi:hypothetical protein